MKNMFSELSLYIQNLLLLEPNFFADDWSTARELLNLELGFT